MLRKLSLPEAATLGALQGPTELLPISSSGHTAVIPWLAGWRYHELEPAERKAFEVALHAGAGIALAMEMRAELAESVRTLDARHAAVVALSLAPPVLAGYVFEEPIERRLGGPRAIAGGLVAGALALALADLWPGRITRRAAGGTRRARLGRHLGAPGRGARGAHEATPTDGLALGLAQAAALIPGVSRNGATLASARARGFAREDAQTLSWHAALPVILGAVALKGWRLARAANGNDGVGLGDGDSDSWSGEHDNGSDGAGNGSRGDGDGGPLAVGAASAFLSTAFSARVLRRGGWRDRVLWPYAAYRCVLAALVLARTRRASK